jgi:hypothetical protein
MQLSDLRASEIRKLVYVHTTYRSLGCPKTFTQFVDENLKRKHTLLEITKHGVGPNSRYWMVAA